MDEGEVGGTEVGGLDVGGMYIYVEVGNTTVFVGGTVGGFMAGVVVIAVFTAVGTGAGVLVANDAPGVRNTSAQAGCVRMAGSRGSKKPIGLDVRKLLFGSRRDSMLVSNLQLGAKRSAHPLVIKMHRNPKRRIRRMMIQSRLLRLSCLSCSSAVMGVSIDW